MRFFTGGGHFSGRVRWGKVLPRSDARRRGQCGGWRLGREFVKASYIFDLLGTANGRLEKANPVLKDCGLQE